MNIKINKILLIIWTILNAISINLSGKEAKDFPRIILINDTGFAKIRVGLHVKSSTFSAKPIFSEQITLNWANSNLNYPEDDANELFKKIKENGLEKITLETSTRNGGWSDKKTCNDQQKNIIEKWIKGKNEYSLIAFLRKPNDFVIDFIKTSEISNSLRKIFMNSANKAIKKILNELKININTGNTEIDKLTNNIKNKNTEIENIKTNIEDFKTIIKDQILNEYIKACGYYRGYYNGSTNEFNIPSPIKAEDYINQKYITTFSNKNLEMPIYSVLDVYYIILSAFEGDIKISNNKITLNSNITLETDKQSAPGNIARYMTNITYKQMEKKLKNKVTIPVYDSTQYRKIKYMYLNYIPKEKQKEIKEMIKKIKNEANLNYETIITDIINFINSIIDKYNTIIEFQKEKITNLTSNLESKTITNEKETYENKEPASNIKTICIALKSSIVDINHILKNYSHYNTNAYSYSNTSIYSKIQSFKHDEDSPHNKLIIKITDVINDCDKYYNLLEGKISLNKITEYTDNASKYNDLAHDAQIQAAKKETSYQDTMKEVKKAEDAYNLINKDSNNVTNIKNEATKYNYPNINDITNQYTKFNQLKNSANEYLASTKESLRLKKTIIDLTTYKDNAETQATIAQKALKGAKDSATYNEADQYVKDAQTAMNKAKENQIEVNNLTSQNQGYNFFDILQTYKTAVANAEKSYNEAVIARDNKNANKIQEEQTALNNITAYKINAEAEAAKGQTAANSAKNATTSSIADKYVAEAKTAWDNSKKNQLNTDKIKNDANNNNYSNKTQINSAYASHNIAIANAEKSYNEAVKARDDKKLIEIEIEKRRQ